MSDPSFAHVPKAVLYHFTPGSVWSAVPNLVAIEKGFTEVQLEKRLVNLLEGQNFAPSFLRLSPKGTVPVLVAPYEHTVAHGMTTKFRAITSTTEICAFLDESTVGPSAHHAPSLSPATVQGSQDSKAVIELVHGLEAPDPNFMLMSFRTDEERKAKLAGVPGRFLKGRQEALERYQKEAGDEDARLAAFYRLKIQENGALLTVYEGKADGEEFMKKSAEGWANLVKTIDSFEEKLAEKSTYIVGDQIALADLHAGAYFARILAVSGAKSASDIASLNAQLPGGRKVGPKLTAYIAALFERESFKTVYHEGLH